jgi:hypothetical protein
MKDGCSIQDDYWTRFSYAVNNSLLRRASLSIYKNLHEVSRIKVSARGVMGRLK